MRIALDNGSVHECAGISLVGITDKILCLALRLSCGVPLEPRREACTATSGKTRNLDFFNNLFRRHCFEPLFECLIAVLGRVLINNLGINNSAVTQCNSCLLLNEKLVVIGNFNIINGIFITVYICDNLFGVLGLNLDKTLFQFAAVINIDDRLKEAHADTTCNGQR